MSDGLARAGLRKRFKEQVVGDGIDAGDAGAVSHQGVGHAPSGADRHPFPAGKGHNIGHNHKQWRETVPIDSGPIRTPIAAGCPALYRRNIRPNLFRPVLPTSPPASGWPAASARARSGDHRAEPSRSGRRCHRWRTTASGKRAKRSAISVGTEPMAINRGIVGLQVREPAVAINGCQQP